MRACKEASSRNNFYPLRFFSLSLYLLLLLPTSCFFIQESVAIPGARYHAAKVQSKLQRHVSARRRKETLTANARQRRARDASEDAGMLSERGGGAGDGGDDREKT